MLLALRPFSPQSTQRAWSRGTACHTPTTRASPPAPLHHVARGEWAGTGRFSADGRRRRAGGVLAEEARTRGGARPRAGRNLDGRMHFVRCRPNPRPLPWQGRGVCVAISSGAGVGLRLAPQGRGGGHDLAPLSSPRYAGGQRDLVLGMHGAGVGGVSVGVRVSQGVGSGRSARQDYLAQPAQAGRQGDGGDSHGTQTVLTRRPGRSGQGYVNTRCPEGGARTVMPRRTQCGEGSAMTRRPLVPGADRSWSGAAGTALRRY